MKVGKPLKNLIVRFKRDGFNVPISIKISYAFSQGGVYSFMILVLGPTYRLKSGRRSKNNRHHFY